MPTETQVHYNKQYLENEIRKLARVQAVTFESKVRAPVVPLLVSAKKTLTETYRTLARAAKENRELSPAGEWLIDNFYIIQEQTVQLKEDLPPAYYKKLPRLARGTYKGYPRIYELVHKLAELSDNVIDQENATDVVKTFQKDHTLKLGELWAVPIMIRLVLIIRLAGKSEEILEHRKVKNKIDGLLEEIFQKESDEPGYLLLKIIEMADKGDDDQFFLTALARRLQTTGSLTDTERSWFDYKFKQWNTTLERQLLNEAQHTSRLHLSIQNAISSLREATETEWSGFVESCSMIERILRLDPSGYYPVMDFKTRDSYRKKVEELSARSSYSEIEVAEEVLSMAERAVQESAPGDNKRHIGYYLIDEGYKELCASLKYRMPAGEKIFRWIEKHPSGYFLGIALHVLVLLVIVGLFTKFIYAPAWLVALTLAAALLPAIDMSVVSINRILTLLAAPKILPKLNLGENIPDEYRTLVVVPALVYSTKEVREQLETLEIRALANPNDALQFAILADFTDAPEEHMPGDDDIIAAGNELVQELNGKYQSKYGDKFYLLYRKRRWNPKQGSWMGWERKRGKLEEFNRLLQNPEAETTFAAITGDFRETTRKAPVKYVITLDVDTKLPPGSAEDLIRTAAHPLNRAKINESGDLVESGYGILQPRVSISPKSANKTWFARIFSGNVGLDPYTTVVSDVYQDLFGEGVFTGKGLYDVEVFDEVLNGRFPPNTVLSHDLLESTYLRTAVLTDIELFDDYPTTYFNYIKRNHRWIRGDWQILEWLFPKVPSKNKNEKHRNPVNIVSKWKIFDNLRRSLNPSALLIFLLLGWTVLPGAALVWTAAAFGIVAFPIYSSFSTEIFQRPARVTWKLYLGKIRSDLKINTVQAITTFLFLPHHAYISVDAIIRTLWRILISKKNLLEWTSASQTERESGAGLREYWKMMCINIGWAALSIVAGGIYNPSILFLTIPFGIGWSVAPLLAYKLSRELAIKKKGLKERDIRELRGYARRTWRYFERYVNEEHSWLPPDNFQEAPYIGAVGRTSPTNIGLGLAAIYTAYEFGYITFAEFLNKIGSALGAMKLLERYEGHFYNWYATKQGEVLSPRYISTVDSGNLAGSLLVVKQALEKAGEKPWPNPEFREGLKDSLWILRELAEKYYFDRKRSETQQVIIHDLLDDLGNKISYPVPGDLSNWKKYLDELVPVAKKLAEIDLDIIKDRLSVVEFQELKSWFGAPLSQIRRQRDEITQFLSISDREAVKNKIFKVRDLAHIAPFSDWVERSWELSGWCHELVQEMDFSMLYNEKRRLFNIGYNVDRASSDKGTYDLLASEARLASFIAIAKGDVPSEHWFQLGRRLTTIEKNEILLSWGGTMFEYLMPVLFMDRFERTLLSNTYDHVVNWQHDYGKSVGHPWGLSESGYSVLNLELHYQYKAFGAPGLGLRRGLAEDYVAAPYSSMLALMIRPGMAMDNLRRLKKEGAYGLIGFYEAIDYTPTRGRPGSDKTIVKMYMAHHQGMSMLALANVVKDNIIQRLFHSDPMVQACELLLQERIPRGIPIKEPRPIDVELEPGEEQKVHDVVDHAGQKELSETPPRTHILSNGEYSTVITHSGTGYSHFNNIALTRWRADRVQDPYGFFFYVKDLESNIFWSIGHQPVGRKADRYDTWFHAGKIQIGRVDEWIESFMEVCVSPEDDIELRKITLTNYSKQRRRLELTSYAEVVLNNQEADADHRAFSNLFVQTDQIPELHALIAKRRPRSRKEQELWMVHTMASDDIDKLPEPLQYETSRSNFIGRGRSLAAPAAMAMEHRLSGSVGNVTDPVFSMRRTVELGPGKKKSITFGLGKVNSRDEAITMADRYDNPYATDRVFELASIYGRMELEHIGLNGDQAHYFQKLTGALIYGNEKLRAPESTIKRNRRTQAELWAYGISGDVPILVYCIKDINQLRTVEQLLKAHALWRLKRTEVDLVIINDHPPSYIDELQQAILQHIQVSMERQKLNERGGVFVLRADDILPEDRVLLETVANAVIHGKLLKLDFSHYEPTETTAVIPYHPLNMTEMKKIDKDNRPELLFFNGYGGFTGNGKEYVIYLEADKQAGNLRFPPAPWINVIANEQFGFITSERGSGYTWSQNSHENRLTPWSNDSVMDPAGEAFYIRDEDQRVFWSPTPGPIPGSNHYEVRHGFGYTRYYSQTMNMIQEVTQWVPLDDPVKLVKIQLTNTDLLFRELSLYWYLDWVLGVHREKSSKHVVTRFDRKNEAIFAQNDFNNEFAGRTAFATLYSMIPGSVKSFTGNRTEFIGRNRSLRNPEALCYRESLEERFGAVPDPCAAFQSSFFLESGETIEFYFILGETDTESKAGELMEKYKDAHTIESSLDEVNTFWAQKLGVIQIDTPVQELNILANGWLQYQNIACRIWARTGFYQSGGAFGFRDQLQDVSSALYIDPGLARKQILLHAARQFPEGDVLHWWHPPTGRGIRSRISDDLLWLPYVTAFYVRTTGDKDILDEKTRFISARELEEGEHEAYLQPEISDQSATLYEHCCRAIDRSLTQGPHGLPLIGTGDWNDGMNSVGEKGKGESVWLGFFLYAILQDFLPLCKLKKDKDRIEKYSSYRKELKEHLNREGWDGNWYRRAYFDDGTPLGSRQNEECKIDAIAQAWSVISKAAPDGKAQKAMQAAEEWLVSEEEGIIRLLTPAFDRMQKNPGYIQGYIPGIRENGGQYTHGALWLVKAFSEMGYKDKALRLLRLLTPIRHSATRADADRYKVEPYTVAADIYGEPPLSGMGGWTWYTGSAGWMYRIILESILGIEISNGNGVCINPYISQDWEHYTIRIKNSSGTTNYVIGVENDKQLEFGKLTCTIDGDEMNAQKNPAFSLKSDGKIHHVKLEVIPAD